MSVSVLHIHPHLFSFCNSPPSISLPHFRADDFSFVLPTAENRGHYQNWKNLEFSTRTYRHRSVKAKAVTVAVKDLPLALYDEPELKGLPWPQKEEIITAISNKQNIAATLDKVGENLRTRDLNLILRYFGRLRRWEGVCQLFDWMQKHNNASAISYTSFIMLMGKGRLPKNALEMYCNLKDENIKSNVFVCNAMLKCLISNGRVETAFNLFEKMQEDCLIPDIITYSTLLSGCTEAQHGYSKAHELLEKMKGQGLKLDIVIYGSLLALCASHGRDDEAEAYFQQMKNEGLSANEFHYSSLLNAYAAKGKYEKAEKLVDEMKSAAVVPNKVVLNTLMKVYAKSGHVEKAKEVLAELDAVGHALNEMPYCTIIDGLSTAGKIEEARKTFDEMKAKGIKSDGYSYSSLISAYSEIGNIEEVKTLAKEWENLNAKYDLAMMNTLLKAYSRAGDIESVMQTLKKMDELKISPNWITFTALISYFCKEKLYDLALRTLEDMQIRGYRPAEKLCSPLFKGLVKSGRAEEAFKVYNQLKCSRRPLSSSLHENMMTILVSRKMLKEAHIIMKDNVKSISETCLKKFAVAFAEGGNIYIVNDVLRKVHIAGYKIEQRVFNIAISRYIEQVKKRELIQLLKWMKNKRYEVPSSTLNSVQEILKDLGQSDIAEIISFPSKHSVPS